MVSTKAKRTALRTTIELKKKLIAKFETGTGVTALAAQYGMARSTIQSIIKNKEAIKGADVAKGVTILAVNRSPLIEEMEKLLLVWITEKHLSGDSVSQLIVCEKAKQLHGDLKRNTPGISDDFKASRGWFDRFKKRSGVHNVLKRRKAAGVDGEDAEKFVGDFKIYVEGMKCTPQDSKCATGHFWRKVPESTFILESNELEMKGEVSELDDELQQFHNEQKEDLVVKLSLKEMCKQSISSAEIMQLLYHWEKTKNLVEKWHPDISMANKNISLFNDNVVHHFETLLENR